MFFKFRLNDWIGTLMIYIFLIYSSFLTSWKCQKFEIRKFYFLTFSKLASLNSHQNVWMGTLVSFIVKLSTSDLIVWDQLQSILSIFQTFHFFECKIEKLMFSSKLNFQIDLKLPESSFWSIFTCLITNCSELEYNFDSMFQKFGLKAIFQIRSQILI